MVSMVWVNVRHCIIGTLLDELLANTFCFQTPLWMPQSKKKRWRAPLLSLWKGLVIELIVVVGWICVGLFRIAHLRLIWVPFGDSYLTKPIQKHAIQEINHTKEPGKGTFGVYMAYMDHI